MMLRRVLEGSTLEQHILTEEAVLFLNRCGWPSLAIHPGYRRGSVYPWVTDPCTGYTAKGVCGTNVVAMSRVLMTTGQTSFLCEVGSASQRFVCALITFHLKLTFRFQSGGK